MRILITGITGVAFKDTALAAAASVTNLAAGQTFTATSKASANTATTNDLTLALAGEAGPKLWTPGS